MGGKKFNRENFFSSLLFFMECFPAHFDFFLIPSIGSWVSEDDKHAACCIVKFEWPEDFVAEMFSKIQGLHHVGIWLQSSQNPETWVRSENTPPTLLRIYLER